MDGWMDEGSSAMNLMDVTDVVDVTDGWGKFGNGFCISRKRAVLYLTITISSLASFLHPL